MTTSPGHSGDPAADWTPRGIDTQTPSTARMYDYYLGGKHHYPADRDAAERVLAAVPDLPLAVRENRKFLGRAVRFMAEAGIRQFLDLGTGLPTQENVHQVAQAVRPDARVAYVDHDPVALAHARALLATDDHTTVTDADLRHPQQVLTSSHVQDLIDFNEPVGVLLVAMLQFVNDEENPAGIVAAFRDAVPPGSYLALSHATGDAMSADESAESAQAYQQATSTMTFRSQEQIQNLLTGFEIIHPGVVPVQEWRPHKADEATPRNLGYGVLGYKP